MGIMLQCSSFPVRSHMSVWIGQTVIHSFILFIVDLYKNIQVRYETVIWEMSSRVCCKSVAYATDSQQTLEDTCSISFKEIRLKDL